MVVGKGLFLRLHIIACEGHVLQTIDIRDYVYT